MLDRQQDPEAFAKGVDTKATSLKRDNEQPVGGQDRG